MAVEQPPPAGAGGGDIKPGTPLTDAAIDGAADAAVTVEADGDGWLITAGTDQAAVGACSVSGAKVDAEIQAAVGACSVSGAKVDAEITA